VARIWTVLFLLTVWLIGTPAPAAAPKDYADADAGVLVYSVGAIEIPMNFTFQYRRVRDAAGRPVKERVQVIECACVGFFRARMADPDYEGRETGKVVIRDLAPGDYEIDDFGFGGSVGATGYSWSSGRKLAMSFRVTSGEAVYIGNYARAPSLGTPLEKTLGAAGFFVISDKSQRDLARARARRPDLPAVTVAVPDATALNHPAIRAAEPR